MPVGVRERFCEDCLSSLIENAGFSRKDTERCWCCGSRKIKFRPAIKLEAQIEPSVELCQKAFLECHGRPAVGEAHFLNGYTKEKPATSIKG